MSCLIRNEPVALTPEERVRQALLKYMVNSGGYPKGLIAVERHLRALPFLDPSMKVPDRRADILVFSPGSNLLPLMLIECKAVTIDAHAKSQVIGYNQFVKAPLLVLASETEILTGRWEGAWVFRQGFPSYEEALKSMVAADIA